MTADPFPADQSIASSTRQATGDQSPDELLIGLRSLIFSVIVYPSYTFLREQIHLFILRIYTASPQETYSEALSDQPRRYKTDLSSL